MRVYLCARVRPCACDRALQRARTHESVNALDSRILPVARSPAERPSEGEGTQWVLNAHSSEPCLRLEALLEDERLDPSARARLLRERLPVRTPLSAATAHPESTEGPPAAPGPRARAGLPLA